MIVADISCSTFQEFFLIVSLKNRIKIDITSKKAYKSSIFNEVATGDGQGVGVLLVGHPIPYPREYTKTDDLHEKKMTFIPLQLMPRNITDTQESDK